MKKTFFAFLGLFFVLFLVGGCTSSGKTLGGKNPETRNFLQESSQTTFSLYKIGQEQLFSDTAYGIVVADNINALVTSIAGEVTHLACQPGKAVTKGTLLAKIMPDTSSVQYKNAKIQEETIKNQLDKLYATYEATASNFDIQAKTLNEQKENNIKQLEIMNKNLENLLQQKVLTSGDINLQLQALEDQLEALRKTETTELTRLQMNIDNMKKQIQTSLNDVFRKVDEVFGFTDANRQKNDAFEAYLAAKNINLKAQLEDEFRKLYPKRNSVLSGDDYEGISLYLYQVAQLLQLAADAVKESVSSSVFPQVSASPIQPSIDGLYATFTNASNNFLTVKTQFDNITQSYQTTKTNYQNQINTLRINIQNLRTNKMNATTLTLDTNINTLMSQIRNLELAIKLVQDQLDSITNTKVIQLNTLSNQIFSLQQQYDSIKNTLQGEYLFAGIDGIIKSKHVSQGNKVAAGTLICQISPTKTNALKIQLYTANQLRPKETLLFYLNGRFLGTGSVQYELPYKDPITQNYLYEITNMPFFSQLKEGDRIQIRFAERLAGDDIWIPLDYVSPRLEGMFVKKVQKIPYTGTGSNDQDTQNAVLFTSGNTVFTYREVKVELGEINGGYVHVLSGLSSGDEIAK